MPTQPSDEIKAKLDIVDVIREYIPVKAAGSSFRALCPFHREKSPSFMISPEKQIWHCFGCGKGGDIFAFVMEMEGIGFPEALRQLATKAGVKLQRQDPKLASQRNKLLDIIELSSKYYHKTLTDTKQAEPAREYLEKRGLSDETVDEWNIGYSSESWDDLLKFLAAKGFKESEIFSSGMSIKREKMSGFYNRFRGRIMFPIRDVNGDEVGFSARILPQNDDGKMGKYINSPQTSVYDKSRVLFGLDRAKMEIKKEDLVILVEGQMDVITAHQHGFKNVVASSGTALTTEQVNLLKRYSTNIALAFDMDKAGEMAAERGMKVAMQMDMNIKVIEVPNGKDPDECIKNSPEEWKGAVASSKQMMDYYLDKVLSATDMKDIEQVSRSAKRIMSVIADIGSKIKQDHWLKILSQRIDKSEPSLREELQKIVTQKKKEEASGAREGERKEATAPRQKTREEKLSEVVLALILKFPELIDLANNRLSPDQVVGGANESLYRNIVIFYNNITESQGDSKGFNFTEFRSWLEQDIEDPRNNTHLRLLEMLALLGESDYSEYSADQAKSEIIGAILLLKKHYLSERMREAEKAIASAEKQRDKAAVDAFMKDFKMLADDLRELNK